MEQLHKNPITDPCEYVLLGFYQFCTKDREEFTKDHRDTFDCLIPLVDTRSICVKTDRDLQEHVNDSHLVGVDKVSPSRDGFSRSPFG